MRKNKYRIFIGLRDVAGYYSNLQKGFAELGVPTTLVTAYRHRFGYESANLHPFSKILHALEKWQSEARHRSSSLVMGCLRYVARFVCFLWAVTSHDVFIMGFCSSFFPLCPFVDYFIIKMLSKKIIYVCHGSDVRPPYLDGCINATRAGNIANLIKLAKKRKRDVNKISKYADVIISGPGNAHFFTRPLINGYFIGVPYSGVLKTRNHQPALQTGARILHCASAPEAKGTSIIRRTIDELKEQGHEVDYRQLVGVPHSQVIKELSQCDFVIEQLFSDAPMAGFATEAAYFGKPAVVGSYFVDIARQVIPESVFPPSMFCLPQQLKNAIETLLCDPDFRRSLGMRARQHVVSHRSPETVARRYLTLIEGTMPSEWVFDPKEIYYCHGMGLSEKEVRSVIRGVVTLGGKESLYLSDKPELERKLLEFAFAK